jgi:AcrR family transcriptional regulator
VAVRRPLVVVEATVEPLGPTAQRILESAKRLLAQQGFSALTLEAIATDAGVNKAATRYHFGSKAGLLEALVDEIVLDECASMAHDLTGEATLEERLDSFFQSVRRIAVEPATFGGFFDVLPHALRDKALRKRLVYLYEVWYQWNAEWLDLEALDDARREALAGLGRLAAATIDGIAIQSSIHGAAYDPEPTLRAFRFCLESVLG